MKTVLSFLNRRLSLKGLKTLGLAITLAIWAGQVAAQDAPAADMPVGERNLRVGVYVHPPFVMRDGDTFTGMAIDLWERISQELSLQSIYVELDNTGDLVTAVANADVAVAVTNLTVTRARAERVDFTHPWFDAGQRIMVNDDRGGGFWDVLRGLQDSGHLRGYAWIAFVIAMATLLVTLFDRRFNKEFPRRWRDGIAESFYVVMSVATSGKSPTRKNFLGWAGRLWQGLWLVCGIAVLAYVTSSVTSVMTTLSLTNKINSFADLPGRVVGVQPGSVSESYAQEAGLTTRPFAHIDQAVTALLGGRIDAIVGDAPVLEYYAHTHPDQPVSVVGPIFAPDKYAFGLTQGSDLTRALTVELIGAHETSQIDAIRTRYFGSDP
ncbi:transporter substrate-binding domain-containing protein [Pararhodobacter zhoushanensis]|uniref:transporter substrate-binding domain-containing protein n=1 Tax=Pararhodobacter zhoushanensis TaxID=2479545 RepID=UPI001C70135B|nr:transporter substrate-binding domain-containing protein [Pararhodobacter zhoushanensis]